MKKSIVLYQEIRQDLMDYLKAYADVHYFDGITPSNYERVVLALNNADGLLGFGGKVDEALLKNANKLKVVSTAVLEGGTTKNIVNPQAL